MAPWVEPPIATRCSNCGAAFSALAPCVTRETGRPAQGRTAWPCRGPVWRASAMWGCSMPGLAASVRR
eukprot:scaffold544_cov117-Isochrysis_galbana.AAC.18